ncbi:MAG: hypothetical protein M3R25_02020 [Bacteroidota bacterium]|nr:hypothetical protein [Bacteroidota bacterium]
MNNVTYLLGAGASFQAIPVQNQLSSEMMKFLIRLKMIFLKNKSNLAHINNSWIPILNLAVNHASIDTYAKKLFITRNYNDLFQLKLILSAYFIYEQSSEPDDPANIKDFAQYSKSPIDPRYDFFMAALLKVQIESPILPENLRIVSWNYDSQIEMAFHPYSKISYDDDEALRKQLNLFPRLNYEYSCDYPDDTMHNQIVKLNGTAANFVVDNARSNHIKSHRRLFLAEATDQISILLETGIHYNSTTAYHATGANINFAWELK